VVEGADPVPSVGQGLVDITATAVNFSRVLMLANKCQDHIPESFTVGGEIAGMVWLADPDVEYRRPSASHGVL
jgi:NADPH:quinone reductase-like Zn-dependent oxidoreductase